MADVTTPKRRPWGYEGQYPADFAAKKEPSLAVRALRGDFQVQRREASGAQPTVNIGAGEARAPQRTLEPAVAPASATVAAPAAPAAAPASTAPRPSFANVSTVRPAAPGDMNTFTGSNGVTRRIEPAGAPVSTPATAAVAAAPARQVAAPTNNASDVQQSVVRALDAQRGQTRTARADAAEALNPMSNSAELIRRLENSQSSYFNKGRPSARRLIGEAIAGQLAAQHAASVEGQRSANDMIERGVGYEAGAMEGAARRQLDADTFNVEAGYRDRALAAEQQRPSGTVIRGLDGNTSMVRNDGSVSTLRGEDGNPIRTENSDRGALTPAALLEAYTSQAQAINEGFGTPAEKAQQQAALRADPLFGSLFGQQGGARAAPPAAAIERLRANPNAAAQFDEVFGPGAAAQYLNR